jgi:hypothetical protein
MSVVRTPAVREVTISTVRYAVACWLRYDKQCHIVAFERGGHGWGWDRPDVFAVNVARETYDVEIKMSYSDFKADMKKVKFNPLYGGTGLRRPTWFYYAAPMKLAEKILAAHPLLPGDAGLLGITGFRESGQDGLVILARAVKHKAALRPNTRQLASWVKDQSGTICGLAQRLARQHEAALPISS